MGSHVPAILLFTRGFMATHKPISMTTDAPQFAPQFTVREETMIFQDMTGKIYRMSLWTKLFNGGSSDGFWIFRDLLKQKLDR